MLVVWFYSALPIQEADLMKKFFAAMIIVCLCIAFSSSAMAQGATPENGSPEPAPAAANYQPAPRRAQRAYQPAPRRARRIRPHVGVGIGIGRHGVGVGLHVGVGPVGIGIPF